MKKLWSKKRNVMRSYDRLADIYDARYAEEQDAKIRAALSSMNLREDSFVLDVGCGTGLLFERIGETVKLLVGLDASLKILNQAKKRAKRFPGVTIVRADADFMPFPSEVFDGVLAVTLLQNMPSPLLTLREVRRVSKHRSIIVVTGLKKEFSKKALVRLLEKAGFKAAIMKTDDQLKGHVAVCRKSDQSHIKLSKLKKMIRKG